MAIEMAATEFICSWACRNCRAATSIAAAAPTRWGKWRLRAQAKAEAKHHARTTGHLVDWNEIIGNQRKRME